MCYWLRAAQINDQLHVEAVSLHPEFPEGSQCGARLLRGLPWREVGVPRRFPGNSCRLRLSFRGFWAQRRDSYPPVMGSYTRIHPKSRQPLWPCLFDTHSYTNARVCGSHLQTRQPSRPRVSAHTWSRGDKGRRWRWGRGWSRSLVGHDQSL